MSIDSPVTASVPTSRARMPYCGWSSDAGRHWMLVKNSIKFSLPSIGTASRQTKKKMPKTSRIALSAAEAYQPFDAGLRTVQRRLAARREAVRGRAPGWPRLFVGHSYLPTGT